LQFVYLVFAIVAEVVVTSALKASNGFTVGWPTLVVVGVIHQFSSTVRG
jgi:small multidrug resistance pump